MRGRAAAYALGDTLSNNGNALDLGEFHQLHGGLVDGTRRGKVDDCVNVAVLANGLFDGLVHRQQRLAGSPVPDDYCQSMAMQCRLWLLGTHILLTN